MTAPVPHVADRRRDVPPAVARLVDRLLAKNPAERPQSAHEAHAALDGVTTPRGTAVGEAAPTPAPASDAPSLTRGGRRGPSLALVVLVGSGAWWLQRANAAPLADRADVIAVMPLGSTMATGNTFSPTMPLHRLAIGRSLRRAGDPVKAEDYLQWTAAVVVSVRPAAVHAAFAPYNADERALAFEAAGDRRRAIIQYERFINALDRPPPAIKQQVDDAKVRLVKLAGDARR